MITNQAAWDERMLIAEERLIQQLIDEQDAIEASYHRQQERDYDAMVNDEPPYNEEQ